jgi:hypothetical protein
VTGSGWSGRPANGLPEAREAEFLSQTIRVRQVSSLRRACRYGQPARAALAAAEPRPTEAAVSYCPGCGKAFEIELPVEPLWEMETAALLLPMKRSSLKRWLSRHRDDPGLSPAQYMGSWGRRRRMLTSADIRYIRSKTVSTWWRRLGLKNGRDSPA